MSDIGIEDKLMYINEKKLCDCKCLEGTKDTNCKEKDDSCGLYKIIFNVPGCPCKSTWFEPYIEK